MAMLMLIQHLLRKDGRCLRGTCLCFCCVIVIKQDGAIFSLFPRASVKRLSGSLGSNHPTLNFGVVMSRLRWQESAMSKLLP